MEWQEFLRKQAKNNALSTDETDTLLKRFPEKEHYIKNEAEFTRIINEKIPDKKNQIGADAITKRMQKIYQKFEQTCPKLKQTSRGKLGILHECLIAEFGDPKPLKRCILGLKGSSQDAQQKRNEITETLRTHFKDKTLSAKVEEGSIILIVESSQTGHEQFKTLIGQKIAGFEVEYVMDEWQDICRRMLIDRKRLTSNTVIGRVYGNRNLIDEDLFVDLALVKPKPNEPEKYSPDIDSERGSEFYTRQEIEKSFTYGEFLQEIIGNPIEKQIAIIGEPGAGKSTLLQKLAFWLLQKTDDLVIWVDLAKLGNQTLGEYLQKKCFKEALEQSREEIKADWKQKFMRGVVWLLLDGLDEMSQSDQQALSLEGWERDAQSIVIHQIVTCRLNLWQANPNQLQQFQTYFTQPFQPKQIEEFIRRWFQGWGEKGEDVKLAESLKSELQAVGKERIQDLCRNPLRLTLLCATWQPCKALPETAAELYAGFVESIYEWTEKEKEFEVTEEEKEQLNEGLAALAKASLEAETSRFRLTHKSVCDYLGKPKAKDSLSFLALKLGWLNEVGVAEENPREKVYAFYHATFQEYFAALAVKDWRDFMPDNHVDSPVKGKPYLIFEPQWKQVILLWLGRKDVKHKEKEEFIQKLVNFDDGCGDWSQIPGIDKSFYGFQAYFLAAAGINEFKACSLSLSTEIVQQLVKWAFGGYFNSEKQQWINCLEPIKEGAKKAILNTIRCLVIKETISIISICQNKKERVEIAYILGEISRGNEKSIIVLNEILNDSIKQSIQMIEAENKTNPNFEKHLLIRFLRYWINQATQYFKRYNSIDDRKNIYEQEILKLIINTNLPKLTQSAIKKDTLKIEIIQQEVRQLFRYWTQTKSKDIIDIILLLRIALKDQSSLYLADHQVQDIIGANDSAIAKLIELIKYSNDEFIKFLAVSILIKLSKRKHNIIQALIGLITTIENENIRLWIAENLEKMDPGNSNAIAGLLEVMRTTEHEETCKRAAWSLPKIITTPEHYAWVVSALKDCLSDEVYQNNFKRFDECYKVIWMCAENLPYPQFYEAWHNPLSTAHPEVTEQTEVGHNSTVHRLETQPIDICLQLQNLPIFCLNATILTDETREGEIALTLCRLIWKQVCPQQMYPRVSTPADLCYFIDELQFRINLPQINLLITHCEKPTPELIAFCQKLTQIIAIAFLTDEPLDPPLKGFSPNQANLISAIQTWLDEI